MRYGVKNHLIYLVFFIIFTNLQPILVMQSLEYLRSIASFYSFRQLKPIKKTQNDDFFGLFPWLFVN